MKIISETFLYALPDSRKKTNSQAVGAEDMEFPGVSNKQHMEFPVINQGQMMDRMSHGECKEDLAIVSGSAKILVITTQNQNFRIRTRNNQL